VEPYVISDGLLAISIKDFRGQRMYIGFHCTNPDSETCRNLISDKLTAAFDIIALSNLRLDNEEQYINLRALIVYVDDQNADLIDDSLQCFKAFLPSVPIAMVVDQAGLQSALLALRCRAWCYYDLSAEQRPLQFVLNKLFMLEKFGARQPKRVPLFPVNDSFPDQGFSNTPPISLRTNSVVDSIEKYIVEHLGERLAGKELAALAGMETRSFLRLFKKEAGMGLRQYVTQCRISRACELLIETRLPAQVIAHEVGFVDAAHFVKVFKYCMGSTPGYYRKHHNYIRDAK
jgi:AraC-like DNA-binding protein